MERCVLHARARARTRRLTCLFVTTRERCAIRDHGDDGSSSERRIHCGARGSGCPVRGGAAEGSGMATGVAGAGRAAARDEGSRKAARKGAGPAGAIKTASLLSHAASLLRRQLLLPQDEERYIRDLAASQNEEGGVASTKQQRGRRADPNAQSVPAGGSERRAAAKFLAGTAAGPPCMAHAY